VTAEAIPRKYLPAFLLLSLERAGTSYGYELAEMVGERGLTVDLAAVYRALRTMDRRGLVSASWEPSESGPDRRVYALTDQGRVAAAAAAIELTALRDALSAALERFDLPALDRS
jgi:PadR family transcriptional regulator PadR